LLMVMVVRENPRNLSSVAASEEVIEEGTGEERMKSNEKTEVLGPTYEPGKPVEPIRWRGKMRNRDEMLKYIQSGERYWYGESHGSEKRKTPA